MYVADSGNKRVQVITLCGRFLRSINVDYCPGVIAMRPDGNPLVVSGPMGLTNRVELMTLFGSLLQVRLSHVYTAHMLHTAPLSTALALVTLARSLA